VVGYNLVHPAASIVLMLSISPLHHHLRHINLFSMHYYHLSIPKNLQKITLPWQLYATGYHHGNCMQHLSSPS